MADTSLHLAILFVDIAGSTRLYEIFGNTVAQRIIAQSLGILADVAEKNKGTVIKTIGDELMCSFTEAESAAHASIEMQKVIKEACTMDAFEKQTIHVRIGFAFGPVIASEGDVFGDAVNVAARVVAQAKAKEILTTRHAHEMLEVEVRNRSRFIERMKLKGLQDSLDLFEILWEYENLTLVEDGTRERSKECHQLLIKYRGSDMSLHEAEPVAALGRGEENTIVVGNTRVSRDHARIEFRGDRFVLVDQSINGSFVLVYGEREEFVRREEFHLRGSGVISLGRPVDTEHDECIHYVCMDSNT